MSERSSYHQQLAQFERGMIEYTVGITGDVAWAAEILGVTEEFLRERAKVIGLPIPAAIVEEPAVENVVDETPAIKSPDPQEAPKAPPAPRGRPALVVVKGQIDEEAGDDEDEDDEDEEWIDEEDDLGEGDDDDDDEDGYVGEDEGDEADDEEDDEDEEEPVNEATRPGRKTAVSTDPALLTRRDVELMLGLSTAAVLSLRSKGQLTAVWSDETKSYLFDRSVVEKLAKERAEKRQRIRQAESEK